ncbi:MAG: EAL domain-containing protein, partial [Chloroflexaceae bacterium]|nr:EAL domain-containing protein [Chloroflexaceae bacterium]
PILNIRTGTTLHVEALVRWPHPEYGLVPPRLFIPIAEETGLIRNLDRWVLQTALQQVANWGSQGRNVTVAVNLSVHSLQDVDLVRYVEGCLRETGVLSQQLIIEVTESAAMRDPETTMDVLSGLKALGMRIALDDFGSGYASLKYLKQLPVDSIKVDRSFVQGIGQDEKDEAVLQTLAALGKGLGLAVVAEGVEHNEQLNWLSRVGYDQAQGYLIGRPMPAESLVMMRLPYSLLTLDEGAPPNRVAVSSRSTTPTA